MDKNILYQKLFELSNQRKKLMNEFDVLSEDEQQKLRESFEEKDIILQKEYDKLHDTLISDEVRRYIELKILKLEEDKREILKIRNNSLDKIDEEKNKVEYYSIYNSYTGQCSLLNKIEEDLQWELKTEEERDKMREARKSFTDKYN